MIDRYVNRVVAITRFLQSVRHCDSGNLKLSEQSIYFVAIDLHYYLSKIFLLSDYLASKLYQAFTSSFQINTKV